MATKAKFIVAATLICLFISSVSLFAQGWGGAWSNQGCGWLIYPSSGWRLNANDRFYSGQFWNPAGLSYGLLSVNVNSGFAAWQYASGSGWTWSWSNPNSMGWLGQTPGTGWHIASTDKFFVANFIPGAGYELFAINNSQAGSSWSMIMTFEDHGISMPLFYPLDVWDNAGNNRIGDWVMGSADKYLPGDFNSTTSYDELFCANTASASLVRYNGSAWTTLWSNGGNQTIGNWTIHANDVYVAGKFTGGTQHEVLFISANGSTSSAMIQRFDGTNWVQVWTNGSNGFIGSWAINSQYPDVHVTGDFDNDPKEELVSINQSTGWCLVQKYVAGGWALLRSNGGNHWIGPGGASGWYIQSGEKYFAGKFWGPTSKAQLFAINTAGAQWAAVMAYHPPPTIAAVTSSPSAIYWGQTSTVSCFAGSPDNLPLTYSWSNNGNGSGYTATPSGSNYTIHNINRNPGTTLTASVTVTDTYGESAVGSSPVTLYASNPPGGGCPYISTWTGNALSPENNLLPQSEYPTNNGKVVTDYYKLESGPAVRDGKYVLRLEEFEHERSSFTNVRLIAVDHSTSTEIAVLASGEIVQYSALPADLSGARMSGDEYSTVLKSYDRSSVDLQRGDEVGLTFDLSTIQLAGTNENLAGLLLAGRTVAQQAQTDQCCIKKEVVGTITGRHGTVDGAVGFAFRERPALTFVPVAELQSTYAIRFAENAQLDYAGVAVRSSISYSTTDLSVVGIKHSRLGEISSVRLGSSEDAITLSPGENVELSFESPAVAESMKRDFVLIVSGQYETVDQSNSRETAVGYELGQNYPNPFNPMTNIQYNIAVEGKVRITVVDVLGRELRELINETQPAGTHSVTWEAHSMTSGTYYVKMSVTDPTGKSVFQDVKKLLLIK